MRKGLLQELPAPPVGKTGWPWTEETPPAHYAQDRDYPKISIVTPSYMQAQFLEETIRSVLLQNYPDLEYIIIDGGSTDGSKEIIKKYAPWISYWVSERDKGQTHAINKGLERVSGEIFNWLNSDDWYTPGSLAEVADCFGENVRVVCGKEYLVQGKTKEVSQGTFVSNSLEETLSKTHLDQPPTFFRMEYLKEVLPLNDSYQFMFDAEFWLRFLCLFGTENIIKTDFVFNYFRLHDASKTVSLKPRFRKERKRLFARLIHEPGYKLYPYIPETEETHFDLPENINSGVLEKYVAKEIFTEAFYDEKYDVCKDLVNYLGNFQDEDTLFKRNKSLVRLPGGVISILKRIKNG